MIEKPYTLADIPHDIPGALGRILIGDVHAIAGSKKRKRSEIAVAIDHQGINIYDVLALVFETPLNLTNGISRFNPQS